MMQSKLLGIAVIALCMAVVASSVLPEEQGLRQEFEQYKITFNKTYKDQAENKMRFHNYLKTKRLVEESQRNFDVGLQTYTLGINQFADMTEEELKRHG